MLGRCSSQRTSQAAACQVRLGSKRCIVGASALRPVGAGRSRSRPVLERGEPASKVSFISFSEALHAAHAASRHMGAACAQGLPQRLLACA